MAVKLDAQTMLAESLREGAVALTACSTPEALEMLSALAYKIIEAFRRGGKVLLCGNGGSAAQAQHIAAEFVGRFKRERRGLPAISLTTDTSILTSLANDYSYESVFARQVESLGFSGDVLIALSTSGNSENVLKAVEAAKAKGLVVAGFTGKRGGKLASSTHLVLRVPSDDTSHIQEAHIAALHAVCDVVESAFSA